VVAGLRCTGTARAAHALVVVHLLVDSDSAIRTRPVLTRLPKAVSDPTAGRETTSASAASATPVP